MLGELTEDKRELSEHEGERGEVRPRRVAPATAMNFHYSKYIGRSWNVLNGS